MIVILVTPDRPPQVLWLLMAPPQNLSHHERDAIGNTPLHQAPPGERDTDGFIVRHIDVCVYIYIYIYTNLSIYLSISLSLYTYIYI